MTPAAIHLHIDELVLDGFDPRQRHEIADTLQRELSALIAAGVAEAPRSLNIIRLERADAGEFLVAQRTSGYLGRQIAKAVNAAVGTTFRGQRATERSARI